MPYQPGHKDAVVREELAHLRADFALIKGFFGGAGMGMVAASTRATAEAAARKDEKAKASAFGQAPQPTETRPPTRPRMNSVNLSSMLPLPDGCDTHFFLVSPSPKSCFQLPWLTDAHTHCRATSRRPDRTRLQR